MSEYTSKFLTIFIKGNIFVTSCLLPFDYEAPPNLWGGGGGGGGGGGLFIKD